MLSFVVFESQLVLRAPSQSPADPIKMPKCRSYPQILPRLRLHLLCAQSPQVQTDSLPCSGGSRPHLPRSVHLILFRGGHRRDASRSQRAQTCQYFLFSGLEGDDAGSQIVRRLRGIDGNQARAQQLLVGLGGSDGLVEIMDLLVHGSQVVRADAIARILKGMVHDLFP